jgi:hypothetical protein
MDSADLDTVEVASGIGHAAPTLNDIISDHELKEEHLQRVCSQIIRLEIAKEIINWKMLGYYLNLTDPDLTAIQRKNDQEALRRVAMLNIWHEREGRNATYLRLAGALYQHGGRDLVSSLFCIMKERDGVPHSRNKANNIMFCAKIRTKFRLQIQRVLNNIFRDQNVPIAHNDNPGYNQLEVCSYST